MDELDRIQRDKASTGWGDDESISDVLLKPSRS
jgi:hypothetical protein